MCKTPGSRIHKPFAKTFFVFFSKICKFECNNFWLAKPYGLANQKLYYLQMLLIIEKSGEQNKERS